MSRQIDQVDKTQDVFDQWLSKTNELLALAANTVTVASNSSGDLTTGNAYVNGVFTANTLSAITSLRGGTVAASANLNITSNVIHTGVYYSSTANAFISAANCQLNTANYVISTNSTVNAVTITGNSTATAVNLKGNTFSVIGTATMSNAVAMSNTLTVTGLTSLNGDVGLNGDVLYSTGDSVLSNTSPAIIDSFALATYRGGKYIVSLTDTVNAAYQMTEVFIMHDGSNVWTTEYATLRSTSNNLMTVSGNIASGNVRLYVTPTVSTSNVKFSKTLLVV